MPDNSHFFNNPLAAMVLLMAAHTPDPVNKINSLNQTIGNLRDAIQQINSGLEGFNTEVMPMFVRPETETKNTPTIMPSNRRRR